MDKKSIYSYEYEHIIKKDSKVLDKAFKFCENYKIFMNASKTERECVNYILEMAKKNSYIEFNSNVTSLNCGDKFFVNNRDKSIILITIGEEPLDNGVNFVVSHIDSPRLDLKPNPVY